MIKNNWFYKVFDWLQTVIKNNCFFCWWLWGKQLSKAINFMICLVVWWGIVNGEAWIIALVFFSAVCIKQTCLWVCNCPLMGCIVNWWASLISLSMTSEHTNCFGVCRDAEGWSHAHCAQTSWLPRKQFYLTGQGIAAQTTSCTNRNGYDTQAKPLQTS